MVTHRRITHLSLAIAACAALATVTPAQGTESLAGTWKINLAKSKYDPAELLVKSATTKYTFSGDKVTVVIDQVDAKGRAIHNEYTATIDGKDSPWKGTVDGKPNTSQDAVSFKKLDAHTYHVENKLQGKVVSINHIVVAADGKSRTVKTTGTNVDGVKVNHSVFYDKQ